MYRPKVIGKFLVLVENGLGGIGPGWRDEVVRLKNYLDREEIVLVELRVSTLGGAYRYCSSRTLRAIS